MPRDKERSKQRFLNAVGEILTGEGYASLKINHIAEVAGLDKKLIYNYFGGLDELLDEYLLTRDFWAAADRKTEEIDMPDGGRDFTAHMLKMQYRQLSENPELQKIILWRLSEQRNSLTKLLEEQEKTGEALFSGITDPYFGDKSQQYRAVAVILVSSIYYLTLHMQNNKGTFCGIDLHTDEGRKLIEGALDFINVQAFNNL